MRRRWKTMLLVGIAALLVASLSGVALAAGPPWKTGDASGTDPVQTRGSESGLCTATNAAPLSDYEKQALLFMREEEKLARDVYTTLYAKWGVVEFDNIAESESRHMASVARLLDRYGLADPVAVDSPGVFANDELQAAYDQLVAQGSKSLEDALQVGVSIEELDIADLEELIAQADHPDISRVMQNLLRGSQNHLTAFTSLLDD